MWKRFRVMTRCNPHYIYIGTAAFSEKQMLLMSWIHDIRCCKDCWHTFCGEYSLLVCSLRISSSGNVSKSWCIADQTIEIVSHIFVCIRWRSNVKLLGLLWPPCHSRIYGTDTTLLYLCQKPTVQRGARQITPLSFLHSLLNINFEEVKVRERSFV